MGLAQILKELWPKKEDVPEVTTSYQYVLVLRKRLDETKTLAQAELERNQIYNKNLYNQKIKKRVFEVGDKVLVLLAINHNRVGAVEDPFEVTRCTVGTSIKLKSIEK